MNNYARQQKFIKTEALSANVSAVKIIGLLAAVY